MNYPWEIVKMKLRNNVSEEIIRYSLLLHFISLPRSRVILNVCLLEVFIHIHNGRHVSTSVAVVGSRENGRYVFVVGVCVSLSYIVFTSIIN